MRRKLKWICTVLAIAFFLIVGDRLPAEPLSSRAMVVGFGIDLVSEDTVKISAQIIKPSSSASAGQSTQVLSAQAHTISGAMNKISERAGTTVALTHCNVVFLCENLAKSENAYSVMNYLVTNDYLSENAYIFATQGKAEDLMTSSTAFSNNVSIYVQRLVGEHGEYVDLPAKTLRDLLVCYHSLGETNWLPVLKKEPVAPEQSDTSDPSSDQYVLTANALYVLKKNVYIGEYGASGARALNYAKNEVKKGVFETDGDHNEKILCLITGKKTKFSYDLKNKTVTMDLQVNAILKEIVDYSRSDSFVDRTEMTQSEIARAAEKIKTEILSFFTDLQQKDADIFGVLDGFYSKYGKQTATLKINDISLNVNVDLKVSTV